MNNQCVFPAGIETCKQALAKAELLESRLPDLLAILSIHFYCTLPERAGIVGVLFDAEVIEVGSHLDFGLAQEPESVALQHDNH